MTRPTYDTAAYVPNLALWARKAADVIAGILAGKLNATLDVTLTAGATTTTVTDSRIGAFSAITLSPLSLNAAGALATTYVSSQGKGTATLTHANAGTTDRNFRLLIIG